MHERRDDPDLLLVSLREVADPAVEVEPEALRELGDRAALDTPAQPAEECEVRPGGRPRRNLQLTGEVPGLPAGLHAVRAGVEPRDRRAPARGTDQVEQKADRRRLARAVGAEIAEDLAGLDPKVEVLDTALLAVELRQAHRLDRGCGHQSASVTRRSGRMFGFRSHPGGRSSARRTHPIRRPDGSAASNHALRAPRGVRVLRPGARRRPGRPARADHGAACGHRCGHAAARFGQLGRAPDRDRRPRRCDGAGRGVIPSRGSADAR